jgi:hypothetical protein
MGGNGGGGGCGGGDGGGGNVGRAPPARGSGGRCRALIVHILWESGTDIMSHGAERSSFRMLVQSFHDVVEPAGRPYIRPTEEMRALRAENHAQGGVLRCDLLRKSRFCRATSA